MHDQSGTNYTVPANKKFLPLGYIAYGGASSRVLTIVQSDDADASTNPVDIHASILGTSTTASYHACLLGLTIATTKYVNVKTSNATGTGMIGTLYGVEQDA